MFYLCLVCLILRSTVSASTRVNARDKTGAVKLASIWSKTAATAATCVLDNRAICATTRINATRRRDFTVISNSVSGSAASAEVGKARGQIGADILQPLM